MGLFKSFKESRIKVTELNNRGVELGAIDSITLSHDEGLPVVKKELCKVFLCNDKLVICASGNEFNIKLEQINNTEVTNIIGIKDHRGRVMSGNISRNGEKTVTIFYLVINYRNSKNEISNIVLSSGYDFSTASKFSKEINSLLPNKNRSIDL